MPTFVTPGLLSVTSSRDDGRYDTIGFAPAPSPAMRHARPAAVKCRSSPFWSACISVGWGVPPPAEVHVPETKLPFSARAEEGWFTLPDPGVLLRVTGRAPHPDASGERWVSASIPLAGGQLTTGLTCPGGMRCAKVLSGGWGTECSLCT